MIFYDHDIQLPRFNVITTPSIWFKRTHKEESDGFIFEYRYSWFTKKLYILEHYSKGPLI